MKRWLIRILIVFGVLVLAVVTAGIILDETRPVAQPGPTADALARKVQEAVNQSAWDGIEAVSWDFGGRHQLLWDRARDLIRVRWDDVEVLRPVGEARGVVTRGGTPVEGAEQAELLETAYAHFINDSFWLNPMGTFFHDGVVRAIATNADGEEGLLIQYSSGGVTPGDAYLWHLDAQGRPVAWQMWVGILPIGGVRASWDGWVTLGGAQIATRHTMGPITLQLDDITVGRLSEVVQGPDPFKPLF